MHPKYIFITGELPLNRILGHYSIELVALSFVIAMLATYVALEYSIQLRNTRERRMRIFWHAGGSIALGAGIWAMHFTGMVAYNTDMEHTYSTPITLASLAIPIIFSAIVFALIQRELSCRTIAMASPFLGMGISLTHYVGMEAMEMRASMSYIPEHFALSIVIAISASGAALWILSRIAHHPNACAVSIKIIAAFLMALAICGMHYTGMEATVIVPDADCRFSEDYSPHQIFIAFGVGIVVIIILTIALASTLITQKFVSELKKIVAQRTSEIQKKQILLDTVVENMPLSLFAKDIKNGYRYVILNKRAQETLEITPEEILKRTDYDFFPKHEADFFRATDEAVIKGRKLIDIPEEAVTTKRGTWFAHTIKVPVYDEKGEPDLLLGIYEDISERKAREKELEDAKNAAIFANKLKSEFLSNISHELRTPMHSIITFSRQGVERIHKWNLDEHKENLQLINTSGERLLLLLNDLLDLSKLEAGIVRYEIKKNDLNLLISNAIRSLRSLIDDKQLIVDYVNDNVSIAVECDGAKITQVIINVLSNAIKFSPSASHIQVETVPQDNAVLITFFNEGTSIPEAELETIFDQFIQSSKTKTGAGGTGLGLAICKEITLGHKGKIWAENIMNRGVKFFVLLPASQK